MANKKEIKDEVAAAATESAEVEVKSKVSKTSKKDVDKSENSETIEKQEKLKKADKPEASEAKKSEAVDAAVEVKKEEPKAEKPKAEKPKAEKPKVEKAEKVNKKIAYGTKFVIGYPIYLTTSDKSPVLYSGTIEIEEGAVECDGFVRANLKSPGLNTSVGYIKL